MPRPWLKLSKFNNLANVPTDLTDRQEQWLFSCIHRNKSTRYGKEHGFRYISTITDYQKQVPVISYQDIRPYINRVENGESDCLFSGTAVAFERTSGSNSGRKLIPYSIESLQDFRFALLPWLGNLTEQFKLSAGLAYWAISPATRQPEFTSAGIPVGLPDAAYLGDDLAPFFLQVSAVPHWVGQIADVSDWQLVTLYYLVCCRNLSVISVWSPTFLLTLMDALRNRHKELGAALTNGLRIHGQILPPNPEAYKKLTDYYVLRDVKTLWPELKVISCWADASSKPFFVMIKKLFAEVSIQPKGLLLTEGVVTIPDDKNRTVLSADNGFYEFMDESQNMKLAHQLETNQKYQVIMTTSGGLYRYQTYDWVKCDGYASDLPILRFIGRESSSDMVGEKLTEVFVTACLEDISGFRMLLPVADQTPGYLLILENQPDVESLVHCVETRLSNNPQYAYARKIGQLKPLTALRLNNPLEIYLNSPLHTGARMGDIKVPSLCVKKSVFDEYIGAAA